jgi:hypothetical protein
MTHETTATPAGVIPVYFFKDLSPAVQARIVERERYEWTFLDFIEEDITAALEIMGFYDVKIMYDLSHCQGSGACITGNYSYDKGAFKTLQQDRPTSELLDIAKRLQAIQKRHLYRLRATITHRGNYTHERSTSADCSNSKTGDAVECEDFDDLLIDLNRVIYRILQREHDNQTSEENIKENLILNEYTYTKGGIYHAIN